MAAFTGEVLVVEPPTALEFGWGTDRLRFELAATGDGCVLTLLDTIDEVGKAARDSAGWHVCLDKLATRLDGAQVSWSDSERWGELNPAYAEVRARGGDDRSAGRLEGLSRPGGRGPIAPIAPCRAADDEGVTKE